VSEASSAARVRRRIRGRPPSTLRVVAETVLISLAAGVLVGLFWWLLAPTFAVEVIAGELRPIGPVGENRFGADAWFTILSCIAGVLVALVMFLRHLRRPVVTVCALAAAGLAGSAVGWRLGVLLGPEPIAGALEDITDGTRIDFPLDLGATGLLFGWPIAAVATVAVICLLGHDQGRLRSTCNEPGLSRADQSAPWSLP
jgi:xanthosine utilization system XapX-like protein